MTHPELAHGSSETFSVIAEMIFVEKPAINFARLVGDLDAVLARFQGPDRHLTWDCEDVAIFDMPGTRIALACTEEPQSGVATSLMISVGPTPLPVRSAGLSPGMLVWRTKAVLVKMLLASAASVTVAW